MCRANTAAICPAHTVNGATFDYEYSALGQRVKKSGLSEETHYVYDLTGRLITEADSDGNVVVEYAYMDGEPLVMWRADQGIANPDSSTEDSLIENGGFESGTDSWFSCSDSGTTGISTEATQGSASLLLGGADCLYQEFAIVPDSTYTVQCDAKATGYASIELNMLDADYGNLGSEVLSIDTNTYQGYSASIIAPSTGAIGAVTFYSEGSANFDACTVVGEVQ